MNNNDGKWNMPMSGVPELDAILLLPFLLPLFIIYGCVQSCWYEPPPPVPKKSPPSIKLPSTEDVGEFAGEQTKRFGKGFFKGLFRRNKDDR